MSIVTEIPAEAIAAAAKAIKDMLYDDYEVKAAAALEAAWPHLLAAAGKLLTEDDCRRVMQEEFEAEKPRLLDEVARGTDERLEQTAQLVRSAERHLERARISNGAEGLKFTLFRPGNGPAQGTALEVVPLAELLKLIGGEDD